MENVWQLDPAASYVLDQDPVVRDLMRQLGIPNLFARAVEFDQLHSFVALDNHPSHWIVLHLWQGALEEAHTNPCSPTSELSVILSKTTSDGYYYSQNRRP